MFKLIDDKTGEERKVGDTVTTFKGEEVTITDIRPATGGSTGRVYCKVPGQPWSREWFPSVIGCRFVEV